MASEKSPVLFIPHGGGPLPLLGDSQHKNLLEFLQQITNRFAKPDAILVISAHWESSRATITCTEKNTLIYDYYGFPEAAYQIQYPAPGSVFFANKIYQLLAENNIKADLDHQRGLDHGAFVPLKIMYPDADIPCLQLSLLNTLGPAEHIQLGQALARLRNDNILILGSGFSFHNLPAFMTAATDSADSQNAAFEEWLIHTCTNRQISEDERKHKLIHWHEAPSARYCHPREEHLLPLHLCYGIAETPAKLIFNASVLGKKTSAFLW